MIIFSTYPLGIYMKFTSLSSSYWPQVSKGIFFPSCFQLTEQTLLSQIHKSKLTHTEIECKVNS